MENAALEMHEGSGAGAAPEKKELGKKPRLKLFLLALLASLLGAALALAGISGIFGILGIFGNFREFPQEGTAEEESRFLGRLEEAEVHKFPGGEMRWARLGRAEKPGMAAATLRLRPGALRAPHWHLNAHVHGVVLQGSAWVGIIDSNRSQAVTFNLTQGQALFCPRGRVHWLQNVGAQDLLLLLFFSTHEQLLTLDLDEVFYSTPEDVAAQVLKPLGLAPFLGTFRKLLPSSSFPPSPDADVWKFFFDLPASRAFPFPGGIFRWARFRRDGTGLTEKEKIYSRALQEHEGALTLASLEIFQDNLGAPHFHFNANELGVVLSGCGLAGVTTAGGSSRFAIGAGDVFFFPRGAQHFLRSRCAPQLRLLLAYSTHRQLETLRMSEYFRATPERVLAQLFAKEPPEIRKIPKDSS